MKTLLISIILILLTTLGCNYAAFAQSYQNSPVLPEGSNPPAIITQVELASPFALFPDNQTCYDKPGFASAYTCSTDIVPGHKVQCGYFIGRVPTQNGSYYEDGPHYVTSNIGPHEKCTYAFYPIDEPISLDPTNKTVLISYDYDGKHYTASTPLLTDVYNDNRTWQFDGNKWIFAEQNNDLWYIGKSVNPNMYVKYKIVDNGTNSGNPYEMTVYFMEHDSDKQYWNATISVVYNGKIVAGTFHLADDNLRILSDSNVSDAMKPYVVSYSRTLDSLTIVATQPGKPLSAPWWCAIGGFSGCLYQVSPNMENVNVTAGTFSCKVLTDKRYETYVNQDTPYPVKRNIGIGGLATISQVPFSEYELLEIGKGYEKIPEFPFTIPILLISISLMIIFHRANIRK